MRSRQQTLVILLQTISSHLANDEIPRILRQGSGSVLRQQLLQVGQVKNFVSASATSVMPSVNIKNRSCGEYMTRSHQQ